MKGGKLPKRQRLIGLWLLLSGISLLGGAIFAAWLDSLFQPQGVARLMLWLGCFSGGGTIFLLGLLLERMLFTPLRHLQVQLARLVANPDAREDYPPEGWLRGLGPDLVRVREAWRSDRQRLATAHAEGARSAARIRQELETLLQVLDMPLLLCDHHRRLLLFNQAAEKLFEKHTGLGLGKRLDALLPISSLQDALSQLPQDGSPRELLIPCDERWLHTVMRRVPQSNGETLLTLTDATAAWTSEMGARAGLAQHMAPLRRHGASLASAAEALGSVRHARHIDDTLRRRLEAVIDEESRALGSEIENLGRLIEDMQQQGERLVPLWSNDLWQSLNERLGDSPIEVLPIGMPAWFKGDAPALLVLLVTLLVRLSKHADTTYFEGEILLGNRRVYLDLIWPGKPLPQRELAAWCEQRLDALPLSPRVGDLLRQHASDAWSLADSDGRHARLRLPLPAMDRVGAPPSQLPPRPEFHDFGIADLPPPDAELARRPLKALEIVAFDTETTGLELRRGDTVISIGACRIVNGRLLASDTFDVRVDPGRPIPPASTAIHGITDSEVAGAPPLPVILPRFRDYIGDAVILAHNAAFDLLALQPTDSGTTLDMPVLDTLLLSRALDESLDGHDLDTLAERYDLSFPPGTRHTAIGDARVTAELWLALLPRLEARGIETLEQALALQATALDREDACT
ncbi:DNA polymerase III subunit epsilon [Halomonas sp. MCCC 1A17488]|uniref:DNA-directed DNA polymerase n=1 Tax=Billgrantia sulfidoxydans TaxID=2733484 RepID=A0ABX7W8L5_9GAMM|nr:MULTISPECIES: 3'-5' exonuclease [Halomonas]MCE8014892.1 DNA polymerase III subunit epsilon [Halomonas sp. MCCC 1A17488]MCG3238225.1 DNA polymerase III subunit epsilon [Halomonas sp. MCCC 1A17488]QPP48011.1 DNA polymerase III subunit epsilon [Halomonas sp. SS10-MC5]QTP55319.1 DNA polymerase III subunit epsilon [Halomonas sulfidoxydans]